MSKIGNEQIDYVPEDVAVQEAALESMDPAELAAKEKALVRKIDLRLMPCLIFMIVLNYLDRNALANARVQGLEADLNLKGDQFNTAISVLFAGYIALQVPSNIFLPTCMIIWGIVSAMTALVKDFTGLVLVRFFLGFVEAPYFPGALFLLSSWYTRSELALRTSILYAGSLLSGGFGGLVGAGVQYGLDGSRGIASWRWLFIIEGSVTVFVAICAIFIIPDFPHSTHWLTAEEKLIAVSRVQASNGAHDLERGSLFAGLKLAVMDYKVWLLSLLILTKTSAGAVTSFIPTLVATFDYPRVPTLLLTAPPYVFATVIALYISWSSDRLGERSYHIVVPIIFAIAGFVMDACTLALPARYLGLFLMLGGVYGSYNVALAWISSTLPSPVEKRSAAIAIVNTVGNLAQIYSPYLYPSSDGPRYLTAMIVNATFCLVCVLTALFLRYRLSVENHKFQISEGSGVPNIVQGGQVHEREDTNGGRDERIGEIEEGFRYML